MHKPIRKAVFPVTSLGTSLLPTTKTIPKEMLLAVDRPLIQYAIDEGRDAGIEQMIASRLLRPQPLLPHCSCSADTPAPDLAASRVPLRGHRFERAPQAFLTRPLTLATEDVLPSPA